MSASWQKVMGFLGMADEHMDNVDHLEDISDELEDPDESNVRKIGRRERASERYATSRRREQDFVVYENTQSRVHVAKPKKFEDVQKFTKVFKNNVPVILNLDHLNTELTRRIFDFTTGLVFGLDGKLEGVGDKVFLLTPKNVNVSAEERKRWQENGIFDLDKLRKRFTESA